MMPSAKPEEEQEVVVTMAFHTLTVYTDPPDAPSVCWPNGTRLPDVCGWECDGLGAQTDTAAS